MRHINVKRIEITIWIITVALLIVTAVTWRSAIGKSSDLASVSPGSAMSSASFTEIELARAADTVVTRDPFRLERKPAQAAFGSQPLPGMPTPPPAPRAQLTLKGIVGGPPWQAIIAGIPGREGSVVLSQGDTTAGYKIRRVKRDTVIVQGPDSAMTLTVRQAWQ